jgi:hypothetical protein
MKTRTLWLAVLALGVSGSLASLEAQQFTVQLKNGSTFLTRYPPEEAPWDATKLVFLTEYGNLISVSADEVASVQSDIEAKGFGRVINATTIALGWAPNDALDPDSEEGRQQAMMDRYLEAIRGGSSSQPSSLEQFVDPGEAGQAGFSTGFGSPAAPQVPPAYYLPQGPGALPPGALAPPPALVPAPPAESATPPVEQ